MNWKDRAEQKLRAQCFDQSGEFVWKDVAPYWHAVWWLAKWDLLYREQVSQRVFDELRRDARRASARIRPGQVVAVDANVTWADVPEGVTPRLWGDRYEIHEVDDPLPAEPHPMDADHDAMVEHYHTNNQAYRDCLEAIASQPAPDTLFRQQLEAYTVPAPVTGNYTAADVVQEVSRASRAARVGAELDRAIAEYHNIPVPRRGQ